MNKNNRVFAHQERVVSTLSDYFDEVTVLTAEATLDFERKPNLNVVSTSWTPGKKFVNVLKFYQLAIPLLIKHRGGCVFSHMTEIQSLLISVPCKILRLRHFLWYAHASKSTYLYLTLPFLTALVSSTQGSCPISNKKVKLIGQGVVNQFDVSALADPALPPLRWYYIGRLDVSKRIDLVIEAMRHYRNMGWGIKLDLYGESSNNQDKDYISGLKSKFLHDIEAGWLNFRESVPNSSLPKLFASFDGFIHAFPGSLDKTLVESVLARRHVVTTNKEFHSVFGVRIGAKSEDLQTLLDLLNQALHFPSFEAQNILDERLNIAKFHTMEPWAKRLVKVLQDA